MTAFDFVSSRSCLHSFEFQPLFTRVLGWSFPANIRSFSLDFDDVSLSAEPIAQLSGIVVFEVRSNTSQLPGKPIRNAFHAEISKLFHENLLIFIDSGRTQSIWYWAKRDKGRVVPREHLYSMGQPGDLFLSKLASMVVDISDFDEDGNVALVELSRRLKTALDVQPVTKKFFAEFDKNRLDFVECVQGIDDEHDKVWYASVLLNRLMFIYFLQKKGFINDKDFEYLQNKLNASKEKGDDLFYPSFLKKLFFEGFAKPEISRTVETNNLLGKVRYLNGGLFLPHKVELRWKNIFIPDKAFEDLFDVFQRYSWNLDDTPGGKDDEINPDVLGYIFEKYINQKAFGAYYTRTEITEHLSEKSIFEVILQKVNSLDDKLHYEELSDMLISLDAHLCKILLLDILPKISILDPACGSGAFLVAGMKTMINVYSSVIGKIEFLNDNWLNQWLKDVRDKHPSISYFIKKRIVTDNLFGVDIMDEAAEIARLRLFLALVSSVNSVEQLEPLPNIDFNIMSGNSLIGMLRIDEQAFDEKQNAAPNAGLVQGMLFQKSYRQLVEEKKIALDEYRHSSLHTDNLQEKRDTIAEMRGNAQKSLNELLLNEFIDKKIKFEEITWDLNKNKEGKSKKRSINIGDISLLNPFHWGYEFDEILNDRGGFDVIIANPPWEVFQTNEKEFFMDYFPNIKKKKLRIEDWEDQKSELMKDVELRNAWLSYSSHFPYQLAYFKRSSNYPNQVSLVEGKAVGNKPNLYSLFTEQCFNLLRAGGVCGMVLPSGIYTDLGTKQLREMLFTKTKITGLFGFENRKTIFEGIHRSFKFVVMTFVKSGITDEFPAAFMRHDVEELERFPGEHAVHIPVDLVRRLSPSSLSISEFKDNVDMGISEKLIEIPLLSDEVNGWGMQFYGEELNMTRSASIFKMEPSNSILYEGSMIWHFDSDYSKPRYWIDEGDLRKAFREKRVKRIPGLDVVPEDIMNDYEVFRLAIRKIASNTNERTLITSIIPPYSFAGNSLTVNFPFHHTLDGYNNLRINNKQLLVLSAILNSFVVDFILRKRMTTNLNLFFLYQLPVAYVEENNRFFEEIYRRSLLLTCTSPNFDPLIKSSGVVTSWEECAVDPVLRSKIRAELDAIIAHLYGLTEDEIVYILNTFPLVDADTKQNVIKEFKNF